MDRFGPTGEVSKKRVHILRWTTFPGGTGILVEWIAPTSPTPPRSETFRDLKYFCFVWPHGICCEQNNMAAAGILRNLKDVALRTIEGFAPELYQLNQQIWRKPELCYQEKYAHEVLTTFFKDKGFEVTKHYTLETAFRASSGSCGKRVVGLICEYDALPGIGHACGHNLIAEVGVGAALGK